MNIFKHRPLALACFSFLFTLALGYALFDGGRILLIFSGAFFVSAVAIAAVALCLRRKRYVTRRLAALALALVFAGGGALSSYVRFGLDVERAAVHTGEEVDLALTVEEITSYAEFGCTGRGRLLTSEDGSIPVRFLVEAEVAVGDLLIGQGVVTLFEETEYDFNERSYYLSQGILLDVEVTAIHELRAAESGTGVGDALRRVNQRLRAVLQVELSRSAFGLASAMFLGNRDDVGRSVRRDFAELGISHLLALSGLHLTILCGFFERILAGIPHRTRSLLLILIALAYAVMTGFSYSVVRAAIMLCAVYACAFVGYRSDSVTVLFVAAVGICAVNPYAILNASFQLSLLAMIACMISARLTERRRGDRRPVRTALTAMGITWRSGVFVCLVTLPALSLVTGRVSVLAPVANLIFIPAATILLTLCPLLFLFRSVPILCRGIIFLVESVAKGILALSSLGASWHVGVFPIVSGVATVLLIALTIALILLFVLGPRGKKPLLLLSLVLFLGVFVSAGVERYLAYDDAVVTAVAYKKNDMFTLTYQGDNYIVDASDGSLSATETATNSLMAEGKRTVRAWILTHYHQRHQRALTRMAEMMYLDVLCLPAPETEADEAIFTALCQEAERLGVAVQIYDRAEGTTVTLSGATLELMAYTPIRRSTHPTLGFCLTANGASFAYLGTSVAEGDTGFDERMLAEADLVYFGSHGPVQKLPLTEAAGTAAVTEIAAPWYQGPVLTVVREKAVFILAE